MVRKHDNFLSHLYDAHPNLITSLRKYTGTSYNKYKKVNQALRSGKKLPDSIKKIVDNIDAIFDMVEPTTREITVYRGVKRDEDVISNGAFISTSYSKTVAASFTNDDCCFMIIKIPVGSKILFVESISNYPEEKEILLSRKGNLILEKFVPPNNVKDKDEYETIEERINRIAQYFVRYEPN